MFYLDEHYKGKKTINMEELTKRRITKSVKNLDIKMKLLQPHIYGNIRRLYLTIQPIQS